MITTDMLAIHLLSLYYILTYREKDMKIVVKGEEIIITRQQERFLKLLYKFRYVNTQELAKVLSIRSDTTYEVLKILVDKGLVTKVYKKEYRIDRIPAYYYLNSTGVTTVRKLLGVPESVVHALYKQSSDDFIAQCQTTLACYNLLRDQLPPKTYIFAKTEINQDTAFPKNRPDLYIRTPDNQEIIVYIMTTQPNYIINKRIDEIISHSEDEGWDGDYPTIALIVKDSRTQNSILFKTNKKLEIMGMEEDELTVLVTSLDKLRTGGISDNNSNHNPAMWGNAFSPLKLVSLLV